MARRSHSLAQSDDYLEEREARIAEIMSRVKHHREQAAKHLTEAKKLRARLKQVPKRRRAVKR